jgi:hypothetical protein
VADDEELIWIDEDSPHDPIANAIFDELHFKNYKKYLKLGLELKEKSELIRNVNEIEIAFLVEKNKIVISYQLPDKSVIKDVAQINWKPLEFENRIEEQLLLIITEAETNALLYKKDNEFKLYNFPAVGFYQPVKNQNGLKYKIYSLLANLRFRFK